MEGDREGMELGRVVIIFLSFLIEVEFFYSAVSLTGRQQSNSVIQFFFRFFSLIGYYKIIEYSSLCYTTGPCCLHVIVSVC